ncbi:hypothetical protein Dda_8146 [Drechslerella dactyloides]|uniref:Uncharacterized protein n=1 Tax=Drechslerella dactyloides TaxID=74499 RepID=A0AAD6NGF9_DREDA|nr:hypothetical protein Dda_8146 [Drechslerella dactyloides]
MCFYELRYHPACGHTAERLVRYCHGARTDPYHKCYGPKQRDREVTIENVKCPQKSCGGPPVSGPEQD